MPYANACFISYKRPPERSDRAAQYGKRTKHVWVQFVETFAALLQDRLTRNTTVFWDKNLGHDPGKPYPDELSKNLCQSVCMVAVLVPQYLESAWCMAEWRAMAQLEAQRLGKQGLIIPVIQKSAAKDLEALYGTREIVDLSGILKPASQLNTIGSLKKIDAIAQTIDAYFNQLKPHQPDCGSFQISQGPEQITPTIPERSPFRGG